MFCCHECHQVVTQTALNKFVMSNYNWNANYIIEFLVLTLHYNLQLSSLICIN